MEEGFRRLTHIYVYTCTPYIKKYKRSTPKNSTKKKLTSTNWDCTTSLATVDSFSSGDGERFRFSMVFPHAGGGVEGGSDHRRGERTTHPPSLKWKWPPLWQFNISTWNKQSCLNTCLKLTVTKGNTQKDCQQKNRAQLQVHLCRQCLGLFVLCFLFFFEPLFEPNYEPKCTTYLCTSVHRFYTATKLRVTQKARDGSVKRRRVRKRLQHIQ